MRRLAPCRSTVTATGAGADLSPSGLGQRAGSEAACAALIALTERKVSGLGQHVDVSAQEAMILTAQGWLAPSLCDNPPAQRTGGGFELLGMVEFRFVYECADGHVTITFLPGVLVGSFTNRLLEWVHQEGHLDDDLAEIDWVDLLTDRDLPKMSHQSQSGPSMPCKRSSISY